MLGLLALVSGAIASDDQSLMQHGLGSASSRAEVQESLSIIKQAIDEIPNPGKVRQMAIDALMKSVSDADQIDDSVVQALGDVINLLDSILTTFGSLANSDQQELQAAAALISSSNNNGWASDQNKNNTFNQNKADHDACRIRQSADDGIEDEKCNPLEQMMTELQGHSHVDTHSLSGYCHVEEIGTYETSCQDHVEGSIEFLECRNTIRTNLLATWSVFIEQGETEWTQREINFNTIRSECDEAMANASAEAVICNNLQDQLDTSFCTWMYHRQHICSTNSQDWDDRVVDYNNLWSQKDSDAATRKDQAKMIEYIKCLCTKLKDTGTAVLGNGPDAHTVLCKAEVNTQAFIDNLQTEYGVEQEAYDDKAACDETFFADHPSEDSTMTTNYMNTHYDLSVNMDLAPSGTKCDPATHHTR